jgi:membrane-bound lytic murein transglycosylase D
VDITRDIDVALAARLADVELSDFKALNPSLDKPVILAAGTPQILLPWDNAKVFERNLAAYKDGQYASWTVWTLPSTMSTAEVARRVGMDETELRNINRIPPRMRVKAGSALIVPRSATTRTDVAEHVADNGKLSLAPDVVTRRSVVRARKGDTVSSLAKRHRVSAASLADWNDVKTSAAFKAGQEVVLMLPVRMQASRDTQASAGKRSAGKSSARVTRESKPSRKKRR